MSKKEIDILYSDLKEGYAVLQGEYERLKEHCDELATAYNNAQKEIRVLKNKNMAVNEIIRHSEEKDLTIGLLHDQNTELIKNMKEISILKNGGNEND